MIEEGAASPRQPADNHLSWIRTRLSMERTLMAWLRTGVAMIGFGFALVQFYERMYGVEGAWNPRLPDAPRFAGLTLILLGVACVAASLLEYRWSVNHYRTGEYRAVAGLGNPWIRSPLLILAFAIAVIGVFAFMIVYYRLV